MLESDYLAMENNRLPTRGHIAPFANVSPSPATQGADRLSSDIAKNILRDVIIPILDKEVNEGQNFVTLRQVYNSLILATWYKRKVKASIMGQAYVDQRKISGLGYALPTRGHVAPFGNVSPSTLPNELALNVKATQVSTGIQTNLGPEQIWDQYVEAFKRGAFNLIKEEKDPTTQEIVPRKYFSGGADMTMGVFKIIDNGEMPDQIVPGGADVVKVQAAMFKSVLAQKRVSSTFEGAYRACLDFFRVLGVKEGTRVVNVGTSNDYNSGLAVARLGGHYIGFDMRPDNIWMINWAISKKKLEGAKGSLEHRQGLFEKKSSGSEDIPSQSQDIVLMLTGVLSDPLPESSAVDVLLEGFRVLKNDGFLVVGTIGFPEWEESSLQEAIKQAGPEAHREGVRLADVTHEFSSELLQNFYDHTRKSVMHIYRIRRVSVAQETESNEAKPGMIGIAADVSERPVLRTRLNDAVIGAVQSIYGRPLLLQSVASANNRFIIKDIRIRPANPSGVRI